MKTLSPRPETRCPRCNRGLGYKGFDAYVMCLLCHGWSEVGIAQAFKQLEIPSDPPNGSLEYGEYLRGLAIINEYTLLVMDAYRHTFPKEK